MKQIISLLLVGVLASIQMLAQDGLNQKVVFCIDENGKFYRPDSDKNYYVFDMGDVSKEDLEEYLSQKINEMYHEPSYFEYPRFEYKRSTETIEFRAGRTLSSASCRFDYSFRIQCKDGRFRIDSPLLNEVRFGIDKWWPEEWLSNRSLGKSNGRNFTVVLAEERLNKAIEMFQYYLTREQRFDNPIILSSPNEQYFHIQQERPGTIPYFKYDSSTDWKDNYMNISMPGMNKNDIIDLLYGYLIKEYRGKRIYGFYGISKYENGVTIDYNTLIDCSLGFLASGELKADVLFSMLFQCEDGVIQVRAPKILSVNGKPFDTFLLDEGALSMIPPAKLTQRPKTTRIIERFDRHMNSIFFKPLYDLQQSLLHPVAPKVEEEW